ncbi:hypothetical protein L3Q82_019733 [Scortum barcoo]|uniref:Uncharacterized protein n=1 Tax=Scortum barcoo TaxID=214431 RepID=A0ACB8VCJ8_9TELE|nr:hypothetical protein L3Q82_019733 [Scortum barcoo]
MLFFPTETMTTATSPILLKWDPKSLEIRTLTVERLLEPLVTQVGPLIPLVAFDTLTWIHSWKRTAVSIWSHKGSEDLISVPNGSQATSGEHMDGAVLCSPQRNATPHTITDPLPNRIMLEDVAVAGSSKTFSTASPDSVIRLSHVLSAEPAFVCEEHRAVTTLVNTSNKGPSSKKKGRSKKAHVLAVSVEQATQNFLEKGEQIAKDSQDLKEELAAAVEDVRKQGETMRIASSEFADDPCSSVKRGTMVRAARALLSAVTRLLILADMADVMRLLSHLKIVEEALEGVKNATNEQDLANRFKEFGKEMVKLNYVAARRQQSDKKSFSKELKDPQCRDEMAAARGALKKNATMLYTASQAFLRHPDVAATRANRDYVFKQVQEAIGGISSAAQATSPTDEKHGHAGIGELAAALNEFDNKIILDPLTFSEARFRPSLEERLESIISGAALMADSSCTRDDRRERIVAECNAVRQALQDLLSEYMNNVSFLSENLHTCTHISFDFST